MSADETNDQTKPNSELRKPTLASVARSPTKRDGQPKHSMKLKRLRKCLEVTTSAICVGSALLSSAALAAEDASNEDLKARVAQLEGILQKEGILPSGKAPKLVSAMSDITISGFVQA